ncbi:MAG: Lipopolysaccharide export system ATP-binding protein LptB [Alphaproteobacteria bacterium MarineAlpha2_Bin1]|nr:MAG: Lipopolysaccharide export system ATP-binding protein LptB [Alphaproteobacteria bacterium MarineAlpha2_Bin1]|tara:strand:- start:1153 stop:1935 length:783 start_codon:yes stop_codon:yes gene_type:complete
MKNSKNDRAVLSIRSVSKSFGGLKALNEASFDIMPNSITGLIGPNGAGKTTLFNVVTGFFKSDSGQVILDGKNVTNHTTHKLFTDGLIRTFQIPASFERMTVLDNLMAVPMSQTGENLIFALIGSDKIKNEEKNIYLKAREVLDFLEITHLSEKYASELSGGQKKLLELGKVMMTDPKVILLDEPGAGVNPSLMRKLSSFIKRLNKERGYTFCIIEHDMDLISSLCDPIIVMAEGSVLAMGDIEKIRANNLVKEAYLGTK